MTVVNAKPTRLRFRRSGAQWLVFVVPFAGSVFAELDGGVRMILAPIAALAVLVPLVIGVWTLRSGVDVTATGLTVKALFGARSYDWPAVKGFDTRAHTVYALLEGDRRVPLPAVRAIDVPRLIVASGGELTEDTDADEAGGEAAAGDQ